MWRSVAAKSTRVTQILDKVLLRPSSHSSPHHHFRFLSISSSVSPTLEETPPPLSSHPAADAGFDFPSAPIHHDFVESADRERLGDADTAIGIEELNEADNFSPEAAVDELPVEERVYEIDLEKLETVLSLLQSSADGSLESTLNGLELDLHEELVLRVLETPNLLGPNLIRFFNWARSKESDAVVVTSQLVEALVKAICACCHARKKDAYALWDLIVEVGDDNGEAATLLNAQIINPLIALLSKLGKGKAAFDVFNKMGDFGCVPDCDTYYYTIEALSRRSFFEWAWEVCEKMLNVGLLPEDPQKVGKIISWFCKANRASDAHMVYMSAKEKNRYPPRPSTNFLIALLARKDETVKLALEMLDGFSGESRKYAIKPFAAVMHGLCRSKDVAEAKSLLSMMIADGPPPGNAIFNLVINAYSKAGDMDGAMKTMKLMKSRGLKPDVYTYTVTMSGYVRGGCMEEACKLLSEAKKKHTKLSPVSYHTLIRGYCKLEQYEKALGLLAEMKEFGVQASVDEYTKLIQSLCLKALDWRRAEELLEQMKDSGLHLNGITKGLIRAVKELDEEIGSDEELSIAA
ncbi:unnamed protein product [Linum trigynum]|uniref:Pentatricopeptide repeat-containing protein n=1 Tax=Linum trigynum TaxID=586398 RepID=A0AAV2F4T8_9ROSI